MMEATLELHISTSTDFPRRFGAAVKAAGGKYSACRGHHSRRYVHLPIAANELAEQIIKAFSHGARNPVIARPKVHNSSRVFYAQKGTEGETIAQAVGYVVHAEREALLAQYADDAKARAERPGKLRAERERLITRLGQIDGELATLEQAKCAVTRGPQTYTCAKLGCTKEYCHSVGGYNPE